MQTFREWAAECLDLRRRELRQHVIVILLVLGLGTVVYSQTEHLRPVDAAYFSAITLATVGYGDISPHSEFGRCFTVIYLSGGLVLHFSFMRVLAAGQHGKDGDDDD
jgi:hypothetical protein